MTDIENWKKLARQWNDPKQICVETIDAHTAGEPLRIFVDGFPMPQGNTILERRQDAIDRLEFYRTGTMWEPRGHADMYGCLIVEPERPDSHFGVLFLHNEGYSSMCGHGIIAVSKVAVQLDWIQSNENPVRVNIDTPAGLVASEVYLDSRNEVESVCFSNVRSFVAALDQPIEIPELGALTVDLAYGGAFYAYVDADSIGVELVPKNVSRLIELGRAIKLAAMDNPSIQHPEHRELSFLYGTIFFSKAHHSENHSRHVCIFADGEVDRSPTGTGVSGRAAILAERSQLDLKREITIESILGTTFKVSIESSELLKSRNTYIPKVAGIAFITGRHQFFFDPDDDLSHGFNLR